MKDQNFKITIEPKRKILMLLKMIRIIINLIKMIKIINKSQYSHNKRDFNQIKIKIPLIAVNQK